MQNEDKVEGKINVPVTREMEIIRKACREW